MVSDARVVGAVTAGQTSMEGGSHAKPASSLEGRLVPERDPNLTHHLANALFRAFRMGFLYDLANPYNTPQAPLKSIGGARIKQQGGSKYDPTNHRLLVYAFSSKRMGVPAMRVFLDKEGAEKILGNMPLELRKPFWASLRAPLGEVFEHAGGVFVPVRFHRRGKNYLDATNAPEAWEWLANECLRYGLVQFGQEPI